MPGTRDHPLDMAAVFRALGDPSRLAIFDVVRDCEPGEGREVDELERSVSEIARRFDLSLSTVSHHLRELRRAGLVRCERHGQRVLCQVDPAVLAEVSRYLDRPSPLATGQASGPVTAQGGGDGS